MSDLQLADKIALLSPDARETVEHLVDLLALYVPDSRKQIASDSPHQLIGKESTLNSDKRNLGSFPGVLEMGDDFDAHLEEFHDYMP